jgi:RNA polymerase sigma factor (TIGR02999 family)
VSAELPLTALIARAERGDRKATDDLYSAVYEELRGMAGAVRRREASSTLNTTALVHEAWIKLSSAPASHIQGRAHFKHIAARAMRQVLVEQARHRDAAKRGGGLPPVTLQEALAGGEPPMDIAQLIDLDEALRKLADVDARAASVVECRFFAGMEVDETAAALDISPATVKRDWRVARAWLARELGGS